MRNPKILSRRCLVTVPVLTVLACAPTDTPSDEPDPASPTAPASYDVLGVVRGLPGTEDQHPAVVIQHAPIPDYVSSEGHVTGMPSMTMPFGVGDVALDGIEVGQWVEFTFEVHRDQAHPYRLTAIAPSSPPSS